MATFAQIKEVRLKTDDPSGFINLLEVSSLPSAPANQTAYKLTSAGTYHATDVAAPLAADWETLDLFVSDTRIGEWIDTDGVLYATCQSVKQIIVKLGQSMKLKRSDSGAESTEWTALNDAYAFYKGLLATCTDEYNKSKSVAAGRWGGSRSNPDLYGGNV
jgi:hypothetical protein